MNNDRDELINMLCDVLMTLAETVPSYAAQTFVDRARANQRFGNYANAIKYLKMAQSYVLPERVTL